MLKKKRFRRKAVGKIYMFFFKYSYPAVAHYAYFFPSSIIANILDNNFLKKINHYINVTKKTIHHTNH